MDFIWSIRCDLKYIIIIRIMLKALALYSFIPFLYISMKKQLKPFSQESIISRIIQKRVKLAKSSHDKIIVSKYSKTDFHRIKALENQSLSNKNTKLILEMMPPRKTWLHLWKSERTKKIIKYENNKKVFYIPRDSVSKNKERIRLTIERDIKSKNQLPYIQLLNKFISEIQQDIQENRIHVSSPEIIPKIKDKETIRPLCVFSLKDNILFQETNSLLVKYYDRYFQNCSFAFRGKRTIYGKKRVPTHHDTIDEILKYQKIHENENIYVAECDLKKFFDTINHEIILEKLQKFLKKNIFIYLFWKKRILHIFNEYLNCYNFRKDILSLNGNQTYLKKYHCIGHEFGWISEDLLKKFYPRNFDTVLLGVPQGGALSGFIANLVLNEVDKKLMQLKDADFLYLRYCDDMIMLHTNKAKLLEYQNLYIDIIERNKLYIHKPIEIKRYDKFFYSSKSKLPYSWGGNLEQGQIPWISFVGYQIGFNGEVRIRKSSIQKEILKQKKMVTETLIQIKGKPNNPNRIIRSIILRLQGMSVGQIKMYYQDTKQSLCWTNGFNKINDNKYSRRQMKFLDYNRCKNINILWHKLKDFYDSKQQHESEEIRLDPKITYSGKPFSYFGWLIHKDKQ